MAFFSIISRVSSGVSVRVPSGLYTESSFAFLSLHFFRILLIMADSLADSVSAQNLRHSLRLVLVWSLLYVLLLMRRLSQRVGLLLLLAANVVFCNVSCSHCFESATIVLHLTFDL